MIGRNLVVIGTMLSLLLVGSCSVAGQSSAGLSFSIEPVSGDNTPFQQISIRLILKNVSNREVTVNRRFLVNSPAVGPTQREVTIVLIGPDGSEFPFLSLVNPGALQKSDFLTLQPGDEVSRDYNLADDFSSWDMQAGTYRVKATYENRNDGAAFGLTAWTNVLQSSEIEIKIGPREEMPGTWYVVFNLSLPPFDNVYTRKAFSHSIDREDFPWEVSPAATLTPMSLWLKTVQNEISQGFGLCFDVEKAQAYLAAHAGDLTGITLLAPEEYRDLALVLQGQWENYLGVNVELHIVPYTTFLLLLRNGDIPHMYVTGWWADYKSPYNFLADLFRSGTPENYVGFEDQAYDDLLVSAALADDESKAHQLYLQAERMLVQQQAVVVPLFYFFR